MIMMSGEDGSASPSGSQINLTNLTGNQSHIQHPVNLRGIQTSHRDGNGDVSPEKSDLINPQSIIGRGDLSTIGRQNPFAT